MNAEQALKTTLMYFMLTDEVNKLEPRDTLLDDNCYPIVSN